MDIKKLEDTLKKMTYSELIGSFMEYAEKDIEFANAFHLFLKQRMRTGGEKDARDAVDLTFSMLSKARGRFNYYESIDWYTVMNDKKILVQDAEHALEFGNYRRAVTYPLHWLKRFNEEFTEDAFEFDDEGVEFEWACDEAMKFIEKVMYSEEADSQLKQDVCKELLALSNDSSALEMYGIANIKTFAQRMKALTESPEEALATIEEFLEKDEYANNIGSLILQKYNLLTSMGRGSEALDFLEDNISENYICSYLVDTLIEKKDYERALSVLEKAQKIGDGFLNYQWLRKEIEIYELLGDKQQVIAAYRRLFIISDGSLEIYKKLKSLIPVDEWSDFLRTLMNETKFRDYYGYEEGNVKAEIFLAENDMDALFQYLMQINYDVPEHYSRYAKKMSSEQQTVLIPRFVEGIRLEASIAKKRDHYIRVCHYISKLKELHGTTEVANRLVVEFLETYRRKSVFKAELKKLI